MSLRERWIVYPLLFLALGIALRDKVIPPQKFGNFHMQLQSGMVVTPRVRCNELVCDRVESRFSQCGTLLVVAPNGRPVIAAGTDNRGRAGMIETFTTDGLRQVRLLSSNSGGMISTIQRDGKLALILGDTGENFGLFAEMPDLKQLIPLTLPWRLETKPADKESSEEEKKEDATPKAMP